MNQILIYIYPCLIWPLWLPLSNLTPELKELFRQLVNWLVLVHKLCWFLVQPSYLNSVLFVFYLLFSEHWQSSFFQICCFVLLSVRKWVWLTVLTVICSLVFLCSHQLCCTCCYKMSVQCGHCVLLISTVTFNMSFNLIYEQILCTVLRLAHVTPKQNFCQFDSYGACTVKAV